MKKARVIYLTQVNVFMGVGWSVGALFAMCLAYFECPSHASHLFAFSVPPAKEALVHGWTLLL